MVPMPVVKPTFKIDIFKMKQSFHMGYNEGDKVFYLSSTNWKGEKHVSLHNRTWDVHWVIENE
jgi:hypothetical protein